MHICSYISLGSFFFNDPATTEIYTLSLHDALPIFEPVPPVRDPAGHQERSRQDVGIAQSPRRDQRAFEELRRDRKSTRLNSSHITISYAVFCLKKKKKKKKKNGQKRE